MDQLDSAAQVGKEISDEMLEAGIRALFLNCDLYEPLGDPEGLVYAVFLAMREREKSRYVTVCDVPSHVELRIVDSCPNVRISGTLDSMPEGLLQCVSRALWDMGADLDREEVVSVVHLVQRYLEAQPELGASQAN